MRCAKTWEANQPYVHTTISNTTIRDTHKINVMNESRTTPLVLILAFVVVDVLFLIFGGAMIRSIMSGGMMGHGWIGGFSWIWIPTVLTLGLGVLLGWVIFGKKN